MGGVKKNFGVVSLGLRPKKQVREKSNDRLILYLGVAIVVLLLAFAAFTVLAFGGYLYYKSQTASTGFKVLDEAEDASAAKASAPALNASPEMASSSAAKEAVQSTQSAVSITFSIPPSTSGQSSIPPTSSGANPTTSSAPKPTTSTIAYRNPQPSESTTAATTTTVYVDPSLCSDSDDGISAKVSGYVQTPSGRFEDVCSGNVLTEYYCKLGVLKSLDITCMGGCSANRCLPSSEPASST